MSNNTTERGSFTTKLGVIAATVGAAVGLGNIWKFPYTAGVNGGGAFIIVYLIFVLFLGLPLIMSEFFIGRNTGQNPRGAFRTLSKIKSWQAFGLLCFICPILILSFYSVVAGWTAEYLWLSVSGDLTGKSAQELSSLFQGFSQDPVRPIIWMILFLILTISVSLGGIKNGIERVSNILMPVLFLILLILAGRSLLLEGAAEGLRFMFQPDFSKITSKVILDAMGQAFFSLSVGMGALITYASYFKKETNLPQTAVIVAILDTTVAILAGIIIFPAVFTFGISPAQGPELVFITLPNVFNQMTGGQLWSILFFFLLAVAALTSTISMSEIVVTYMMEEYKLSRKKILLGLFVVCSILGSLCSLSLGVMNDIRILGRDIFSLVDFTASNILMTLGGASIVIFVGWFVNKEIIYQEMLQGSKMKRSFFAMYYYTVKYIAPVGLITILLSQFGLI
ncbi:MAG: sodium-dependent transporter [Bacteroidales bacterium]